MSCIIWKFYSDLDLDQFPAVLMFAELPAWDRFTGRWAADLNAIQADLAAQALPDAPAKVVPPDASSWFSERSKEKHFGRNSTVLIFLGSSGLARKKEILDRLLRESSSKTRSMIRFRLGGTVQETSMTTICLSRTFIMPNVRRSSFVLSLQVEKV